MSKPKLPRGVRDFGTTVTAKRNLIIDTIRDVFRKFGFEQLETPAIESLDVLTGKYGEEGDQLIFKILNSGDYLDKVPREELLNLSSKALTPKISEKALRYDLTVPFARYVTMNRHQLTFPFKRYQIQPVWRADRPQKGRYREFYQCDADVIGTSGLICEAEMVLMIAEVLDRLGISDFTIYINNRKILSGIAAYLGYDDYVETICVAVDKFDKIGREGVVQELKNRGIAEKDAERLMHLLQTEGDNAARLSHLAAALQEQEEGAQGVEEINTVIRHLDAMQGRLDSLVFEPSLARGLSYYTGAIFEVKVNNVSIGSISGGGRYDDLTSVFGLPDVSGVGISFGLDRVYDVMENLGLFQEDKIISTQVLVTNFDENTQTEGLKYLNQLRKAGIKAEIYPVYTAKMKKQFAYADHKNIPYVLIIGHEELESGSLSLKNMKTGSQSKMHIEGVIASLQ